MKILLIYSYWLEHRPDIEDVRHVPMGLYYIAALLREHGHEAEVLNWGDMRGRHALAEEVLVREQPDVVGFSVLQANRLSAMELTKLAKKAVPGCATVFGGASATFLWEFFLEFCPELDFVVRGEGELTFLELVQRLEARVKSGAGPGDGAANENFTDINGLALRRDGQLWAAPDREPVADLDSLPNPARYFTYNHVSLTRGCPGNCTFCGSPRFWGRRVRFHSPEYFVDQIRLLHERGVEFFYVSDDTFTLDKKRAARVCELMIEQGLDVTWNAISRADMVDENLLGLMRRAGCIQISFGVESGSEEIRARLGKRVSNADVVQAFAMAKRQGILPRAYYIYGSPGETWETIQQSMDLMAATGPLVTHFFVLSLFPGTALYEQYVADNPLPRDFWLSPVEDIKYFNTDPDLPEERVREFGQTMKQYFHAALPGFAESVELNPDPNLAPLQSDFLARLGMTFDHGDYSDHPDIPNPRITAAELYQRALNLHPDATAFYGLGRILMDYKRFDDAAMILGDGSKAFSDHQDMHLALAVSLMNLGRFQQALEHLESLPDNDNSRRFIQACRQNLQG